MYQNQYEQYLYSQPRKIRRNSANPANGCTQPISTYPHIAGAGKLQTNNRSPAEIAQFVSSVVYFLLYGSVADHDHPSVINFESFIRNVLSCSSSNVGVSVLCISLLYMARFIERSSDHYPIIYNEKEIWTIALMLADSNYSDNAYSVKSWSNVTNIPLQRCLWLRRQFMEILRYDLHVTVQQYHTWLSKLKMISNHVNTALAYHQFLEENKQAYGMIHQTLMRPNEVVYARQNTSMITPPMEASSPDCSLYHSQSQFNYFNNW